MEDFSEDVQIKTIQIQTLLIVIAGVETVVTKQTPEPINKNKKKTEKSTCFEKGEMAI